MVKVERLASWLLAFGSMLAPTSALGQEAVPPPPAAAPPSAATPALPSGIAGWFPDDGFAIKSSDGAYKLRFGLQAGLRFEPYWRDGVAQDRRELPTVRLLFEGNVFRPWLRYRTSLELAQNPPYLLDCYLDVQRWKELGVRLGQHSTPISRHEFANIEQILFPDWAQVANYFWTGRDKGATLQGSLFDGRFDYRVGAYAASPLRQYTSFDGAWAAIARLTFSPLGESSASEVPYLSPKPVPFRFAFSLQGAAGDYRLGTENFNPTTFRFDLSATPSRKRQQLGGVDLSLQHQRVSVMAEAYLRRMDPSDGASYVSKGAWGQVGVALWKRMLDIGVRANVLDASDELSNDFGYALEGMLGYYPFENPHLSLKLRYGYGHQDTPGSDALGSVALLMPPGTNHLLTAQITLAL